jgi:hypothetical protein
MAVSLDHLSVAAPRGSAAEDRLVKNLQPPLPEPDHAPQELRLVIKTPLRLGGMCYETVAINDLAFCRARGFSLTQSCTSAQSVGQECVLPAWLLSPYPYSRPDWLGVAQIHAGLRYPDASHWSEQPDWINNEDNWIASGTWAVWLG